MQNSKIPKKANNYMEQNQTHIFRLKEALESKAYFVSVVVFVNNNTNYIESDNVWNLSDLKYLIDDGDEKQLSPNDVIEIIKQIKEYKDNPIKTYKEHVKEVKHLIKDIDNNICPRCGGTLVLRKGTNGSFYGCSNFPKCKFTKKA